MFPWIPFLITIFTLVALTFAILNNNTRIFLFVLCGLTLLLVALYLFKWYKNRCGPLDPNRVRLYCGTNENIPEGYLRFGTPYECLKSGIGVGRCMSPR